MRFVKLAGAVVLACGCAVLLRAVVAGQPLPQSEERVIRIQAMRFTYIPQEIVLKRGKPVILEFTSLDFVHGFRIPDLKSRADLPPGKPTRIRLVPETTGTFDFLCDNFCGAAHEEMGGRIIVQD